MECVTLGNEGHHLGFGLGGPQRLVAVGELSLDHAGSQLALRAVVGGLHLAEIIAEGQKLASSSVDFGLQVPRQWTNARGGEERRKAALKRALFSNRQSVLKNFPLVIAILAVFQLFEPEAVIAGFQDVAGVGNAIEEGGGHLGIAEHVHPAAAWLPAVPLRSSPAQDQGRQWLSTPRRRPS